MWDDLNIAKTYIHITYLKYALLWKIKQKIRIEKSKTEVLLKSICF